MTENILSESQMKVLLALADNGALSYEELAGISGLSYDGVRGRVSELKKKGFDIRKVKEGKNTKLVFDEYVDKPVEKLSAPVSYGDMISKRTKSLADFNGIINLLNELKQKKGTRVKKVLKVKNKCGVLVVSDLHFGSVTKTNGETTFDSDIAEYRIEQLTSEVMYQVDEYGLETLYITMVGDMVDGDTIYRNHAFYVEKPAIEQVQDVTRALSNMIKTFSHLGLSIIVGCVRGNHGITNYKNLEEDNWDNVIYDMLGLVFVDDANVSIRHYTSNEAKMKILDRHAVLTHGYDVGDQIRTASGARNFRGLVGKHKLEDNDFVIIGHLHTFEIMIDQSKFLLRNGSLADTSDYAISKNLYNEPCQTFMVFEEGKVHPIIIPIEFER